MDEGADEIDDDEIDEMVFALAFMMIKIEDILDMDLGDTKNYHVEFSSTEPIMVIRQEANNWQSVVYFSKGKGYIEYQSKDKKDVILRTKQYATEHGLQVISALDEEFVSIQQHKVEGKDVWIVTIETLNGKTQPLHGFGTQEKAIEFGEIFMDNYNRDTKSSAVFAPYFWYGNPETTYVAKFPILN